MREDVLKLIQEKKLIAIVRGIAPEKCVAVADALYEGGFRLMEITFNQKGVDQFLPVSCIIQISLNHILDLRNAISHRIRVDLHQTACHDDPASCLQICHKRFVIL